VHIKRNVVVIVTDGMAVVVSLALINSLKFLGKILKISRLSL